MPGDRIGPQLAHARKGPGVGALPHGGGNPRHAAERSAVGRSLLHHAQGLGLADLFHRPLQGLANLLSRQLLALLQDLVLQGLGQRRAGLLGRLFEDGAGGRSDGRHAGGQGVELQQGAADLGGDLVGLHARATLLAQTLRPQHRPQGLVGARPGLRQLQRVHAHQPVVVLRLGAVGGARRV
jgi:hypothetical protein